MKKHISILLVFLFLLPLSVLGAVSAFDTDATVSTAENRALASFPEFSGSALFAGNWSGDFNDYYNDTFPFRDRLLKANRLLNRFYIFSPYSGESEDVSLIVSAGEDQIADAQPDPKAEPAPAADAGDAQPKAQAGVDLEASDVILSGGRAMYTAWKNDEMLAAYRQNVTALDEKLEGIPVAVLVAPNAGAFYSPEEWHTGHRDQRDIIETACSGLPDTVTVAEVYDLLAAHTEEEIYFRTDHHWTQLGAYDGYCALCTALDVTPVALSDLPHGTVDRTFLGSLYTLLSEYPQASVLEEHPDKLEYWVNQRAVKSCEAFMDTDLTAGWETPFLDTEYEGENLYNVFLGGDQPLMRIVTTCKNGERLLIVKDSFANALIPYLTSHYSEIWVVDPRYFNLKDHPAFDLISFVREQEIDRVFLLNSQGAVSNASYERYFAALIGERMD